MKNARLFFPLSFAVRLPGLNRSGEPRAIEGRQAAGWKRAVRFFIRHRRRNLIQASINTADGQSKRS
jgi:hypothetical protein